MLKHLFISKIRIRVLDKYMHDINKSYHVRGLVRELEEEINAIRRELLNLKKAGLLTSKKDGNKIMYSINKDFPILWELRSMFFKESEIGKLLHENLSCVEGIKVGIVTEAFMKKKYDQPTDVDMLFIGDMKIRELSSTISKIEKELKRPIKFVALKVEDFEFGKRKKDPIIVNTLSKDKIIILGKDSDLL
jgi:DNA-binding transcriptional ArsR family regulator